MRVVDLIYKKRDGGTHTEAEIRFLVQGYTQKAIPDYQMSAWLMAAFWRGLTDSEIFALTEVMVQSGETLDLSSLPGPTLDKHSTGGIGDKTSLAVVPILAAGGIFLAKMSGRGLGHTGGTLDKLESIPGMRVQLTSEEIRHQVREVGACICAQTETLVPADARIYALRDATATVESLPLIASSIMSKKLAGGASSLLLDVKVGSGAFMKTEADARALADVMMRIGRSAGRTVAAVLSDMDLPLGRAIGNRLEMDEVAVLLQNDPETDPRLRELTCYLAALGFVLAGKASSVAKGMALTSDLLRSGAAFEKLCQIVSAQGGDVEYLRDPQKPPVAPVRWDIKAERDGWVTHIDADSIGWAAMLLGAGRPTKEDTIDPTAGIMLRATVGAFVTTGSVLATLYTSKDALVQETSAQVAAAFALSNQEPDPRPIIYDTLGLV